MPSVLWRCWLGGRKGVRPVKKLSSGVLAWLSVWSKDLHMVQLMPLPLTVSCFSKIQIGSTFLVPAHLGSQDKGPLNKCVCVHTTELKFILSHVRCADGLNKQQFTQWADKHNVHNGQSVPSSFSLLLLTLVVLCNTRINKHLNQGS